MICGELKSCAEAKIGLFDDKLSSAEIVAGGVAKSGCIKEFLACRQGLVEAIAVESIAYTKNTGIYEKYTNVENDLTAEAESAESKEEIEKMIIADLLTPLVLKHRAAAK